MAAASAGPAADLQIVRALHNLQRQHLEEAHLGSGNLLEGRLDPEGQRARHATLPLFKPHGRRKPTLVGCSVALRRGEDYFLLSARHVVIGLEMNDFHIWTPDSWIMAKGQIARTDPNKRGRDPFDASVIRLDEDVVNDHVRSHALTIDDLDVDLPAGPRHYLMQLVGYPGGEVVEKAPKALSPTWFQWAGIGASEEDYEKRGRSLQLHSVFHFDRAQAMHDSRGKHPGPDMHGASGSGMWRMLPVGEDVARKRLSLLNAIFTDYSGRTIIGTRTTVHISLINKYFVPAHEL